MPILRPVTGWACSTDDVRRNGWLVGLGVLAAAVGIGAAVAAGGDSDDAPAGDGNNCGLSGTVIGPGDIRTNTNCTR